MKWTMVLLMQKMLVIRGGGFLGRKDEGSIANFVVVFCDITDILSPYRCTLTRTGVVFPKGEKSSDNFLL